MRRITITIDEELAEAFDQYLAEHGYLNRSEGIRDMLRAHLQHQELRTDPEGACVAVLSYVYNHHERELARRLTHYQHDHHDLAVSTLHVHLDHNNCLETSILKGTVSGVRSFAERLIAQTGVRHGQLQLIPARIQQDTHEHGPEGAHSHSHTQPLN